MEPQTRNLKRETSSFQRRRPLFWLTVVFCGGIACDAAFAPALSTLGGFFLAALATTVWYLLSAGAARSSAPAPGGGGATVARYGPFICAAAVALAVGMLLHAVRARIPPGDDISRRTPALPSFVWLRGTIIELEHRQRLWKPAHVSGALPSEEYQTWTFSVEESGADASNLSPASGRVQLTCGAPAPGGGGATALGGATNERAWGEGDRVEFRARIEAPPEVTLPDSFDYAGWLESQGIRRSGVILADSLHLLAGPSWRRPDLLLRRFSASLCDRVFAAMPAQNSAGEESSPAGLLNALLFGRRERLAQSDREAFAISGTAHLLVIAGLHLQFIIGLVWHLLALFGFSRRRGAWLVMGLACAYCALAGAQTPVVRATVMIVVYLAALLVRREPDPLNVLAAAALAILCVAPAELFSAGFQLSFAAVLALVTLRPALEEAWQSWRDARIVAPVLDGQPHPLSPSPLAGRGLRWVAPTLRFGRTAIFVTLAASLATAPIVAWHMGRFSTLGLLVNYLAVPVCGVCMMLGLVLVLATGISALLAACIAPITAGSLWLLQALNHGSAALPFAAIDLPPPAVPVLLIYAGILGWLWIEHGRATPGRVGLSLAACVLVLNAGVFFRETPPAPALTVLDLPHGRAALVEAPDGGAALIDTGGFKQGARIAELLRRKGIHRLALAVITEDEPDAIDGALDVLQRVPAARVLLPRNASASDTRRELERWLSAKAIPYGAPVVGEVLRGPGEVRWEFADDGPPREVPASAVSSLSVRLTLPGTRVLFVTARSGQGLERLLAKAGGDTGRPTGGAGAGAARGTADSGFGLEADILRLAPGQSNRWPPEITQLIRRTHCHTLIAGAGVEPDEIPGPDLAALAQALEIRLLSPHRDGSVRVQADIGTNSRQALQAYRGGVWQEIR